MGKGPTPHQPFDPASLHPTVVSLSPVAWLIGYDEMCCGFTHAQGQFDSLCSAAVWTMPRSVDVLL